MKSRAFIATLVAAAGSAHAQWSDNFNRPDGLIGGDWTTVSGTWAIQSNRGAHTSPAVNTILSHNLASGPYQQSTSQIDVFRPTGTTADSFVALMIGLGGADAIQVKVQSQGSSPNFNFLGIYHGSGANWGPWTGGLPFQALSAPFSSARLTVTFPNPDTLQLLIDTNFDGIPEQAYNATNVSSISAGFGTSYGIGGWAANAASFDNWSVNGPGAVLGACCLPSGVCTQQTQNACTSQLGVYQGNGVACGSVTCPQTPTGSCCLIDGTCTVATSANCTAVGGVYGGNNTTCASAPCTAICYDVTGLNVPILDGGQLQNGSAGPDAVATLNVSATGTIASITAKVKITHTYQGDIRFKLVHPDGTQVVLVNRPAVMPPKQSEPPNPPIVGVGFSNDNFGNTVQPMIFKDGAASGVYDNATGFPGPPPGTALGVDNVAGLWAPVGSLATLAGKPIAGAWKLIATDYASGDTGTINSFSICVTTPVAATCYVNCDNSSNPPCLNVNDYVCFNSSYAAGSSYANCDNSTVIPVLNVNDFVCFNTKYAAGCVSPCSPH